MSKNSPRVMYPDAPRFRVWADVVHCVLQSVDGASYQFLDNRDFSRLARKNPPKAIGIYYEEILMRSHWAATTALLRHFRWHTACKQHYDSPNFLAFSACLRGMVESAADAFHTLNRIPMFLAQNYVSISSTLITGRPLGACKEIEDSLIHFAHGIDVQDAEDCPVTFRANAIKEYLASCGSDGPAVRRLYSELCRASHPAAHSSLFISASGNGDPNRLAINKDTDRGHIAKVVDNHAVAIEMLLSQGIEIPLVLLKMLNLFSLSKLHTPSLEKLSFYMPLWNRIEGELTRQFKATAWNRQSLSLNN